MTLEAKKDQTKKNIIKLLDIQYQLTDLPCSNESAELISKLIRQLTKDHNEYVTREQNLSLFQEN